MIAFPPPNNADLDAEVRYRRVRNRHGNGGRPPNGRGPRCGVLALAGAALFVVLVSLLVFVFR